MADTITHQPTHTSTKSNSKKEVAEYDLEKQATASTLPSPDLHHTRSHVTNHDMPAVDIHPTTTTDSIYDTFSPHRKTLITIVLAWCGFLAPISSTTVLSAVPEVASTFHTSGSIINLTNALYLIFMGLSPCFWGPMGQVYGRRWTCVAAALQFTAFSIGTALAPNLASFFVFRILTAFQGTAFLIVGASCIGDIYRPVERATALGWFLSGTLIGPAFGPFVGGIIVTFRSWRDIFWLQSALSGVGTLLVLFLLPETIHWKRSVELRGLSKREYVRKIWAWTNPLRVVRLYRYPNLAVVGLASSSLVWNMYSLLTPIRYVLNPRFHLDSPLQSGLFYIAPGCGYLFGTFVGGRWADYTVRKWMKKRNGERVPEDRLRSSLLAMGGVIPACILIYGWSVEKAVGGVPLPVIVMFIQGIAQLFCFPSLNAYCLDVIQKRSGEVVAGNYMVRYVFAAIGTAVVLPAVEGIGVGWFSTISALFLVVSAIAVYFTCLYGRAWREKVDKKKEAKKERRRAQEEHSEDHDEEQGQDEKKEED
jgi:MFS family permease